MSASNKIITTEDGSHSLYNSDLNETYHSFHGAIQESQHVFIKNGLEQLVTQKTQPLNIFEVGFGTGLNALLSALFAIENDVAISYTSIEAYPVTEDLINQLNYDSLLNHKDAKAIFQQLHTSSWEEPVNVHPLMSLTKIKNYLGDYLLHQNTFDLVYYDAFAPSKQSDMWTLEILSHVTKSMTPGGLFVTYCAQGQLKRNLKELGFEVETLPGPPGKKEMVRGVKLA